MHDIESMQKQQRFKGCWNRKTNDGSRRRPLIGLQHQNAGMYHHKRARKKQIGCRASWLNTLQFTSCSWREDERPATHVELFLLSNLLSPYRPTIAFLLPENIYFFSPFWSLAASEAIFSRISMAKALQHLQTKENLWQQQEKISQNFESNFYLFMNWKKRIKMLQLMSLLSSIAIAEGDILKRKIDIEKEGKMKKEEDRLR